MSRIYKFSVSGRAFDFAHKNSRLVLESCKTEASPPRNKIAALMLRYFVQENSEFSNIRQDGNIGDFEIGDWEVVPADESPTGYAAWGFAFRPSSHWLDQDQTFEEAVRHARICAWWHGSLGEPLDYCVISRFSLDTQKKEYQVMQAFEILPQSFAIEATIYGAI